MPFEKPVIWSADGESGARAARGDRHRRRHREIRRMIARERHRHRRAEHRGDGHRARHRRAALGDIAAAQRKREKGSSGHIEITRHRIRIRRRIPCEKRDGVRRKIRAHRPAPHSARETCHRRRRCTRRHARGDPHVGRQRAGGWRSRRAGPRPWIHSRGRGGGGEHARAPRRPRAETRIPGRRIIALKNEVHHQPVVAAVKDRRTECERNPSRTGDVQRAAVNSRPAGAVPRRAAGRECRLRRRLHADRPLRNRLGSRRKKQRQRGDELRAAELIRCQQHLRAACVLRLHSQWRRRGLRAGARRGRARRRQFHEPRGAGVRSRRAELILRGDRERERRIHDLRRTHARQREVMHRRDRDIERATRPGVAGAIIRRERHARPRAEHRDISRPFPAGEIPARRRQHPARAGH